MRAFVLLLLIALAACGGGGTTVQPVAAPTSAKFTISVPAASNSQATSRAPAYVSASTQSIVITLATVNGTAFTGSPSLVATNLTTSNPACSSSGGTLTCTMSAPAVAGTDTFTINTYDAQQTSSSPATPAGNLLSTATVSLTVVAGQANAPSMPLVLNGIAKTIIATFAADPHISGSAAAGYSIVGNRPYTLTFSAQDASGAAIVGAGAPTLTSGSSALAITQVNATTYTVQVKSYSASPVSVTLNPPLGSAPSIAFTTIQELWVADQTDKNVTAYALVPNCSPSCTQIMADTITASLNGPTGLAFDSTGNLWVSDLVNNAVREYVPGTNTVTATISITVGSPRGIAFDASGNLWVTTQNGFVTEYKPPLNGASASATISAGLEGPRGLAFDASGNLWVANFNSMAGNTVTEYVPGNAAPVSATISSGINEPYGLAFDANGNLWVGNAGSDNATEYKPPINGAAPSATISSGLGGGAYGMAFDATGNLYVVNNIPGDVLAFVPANGATPNTGTPITVGIDPLFIAISP